MRLDRFAFAAVGVSLLLGSTRASLADTITLQNLSHNDATGEYQYTITLDPEAYVQNGDGFVIYNFPNLVTTGPDVPTITPAVSDSSAADAAFGRLAYYSYGTYTNPSLPANYLYDQKAAKDADYDAADAAYQNSLTASPPASFPPPTPSYVLDVPNVTFYYNDPSGDDTFVGDGTDTEIATLTLYTIPGSTTQTSVYASVDRSGTSDGTSYGLADGTIATPVPEPSSIGLLALGAVGLLRKRRNSASKV
ncbi:MAG TPA: PEP-CTERM sorting domain-containing protein [Phycisphaerae bacterium]|nr:PEP-CTERM sorting domain-containing protein [Phycisphaerae bacterium]